MYFEGINWIIAGGESGPEGASDRTGLGDSYSRSMPAGRGSIFFQAMGWVEQEESRAGARGVHVG